MQNARLDESQAGIKIVERNINNLRYADDSILRAESEVELKSLLKKVKKKREKAGLNWIASLCLTQDTACLGLVHGDDPQRCYGEGGGRGVHVWERM